MVNFLEFLYFLTGLSVVVALGAMIRRRREAARRFGMIAVAGVAISFGLYQYLSAAARRGATPVTVLDSLPGLEAAGEQASFERLVRLVERCGEHWGVCGRRIETAQLPLAAGRARRDSAGLWIRLADGTFRLLNDSVPERASRQFHAWLPEHGFYLVHLQYVEGDAYEMVSERTGTAHLLDDFPVFSRGQDRFAVASGDLETQYNPTSLSVWRIGRDSLVREFDWRDDDHGDGWYPHAPVWAGDTLISVTQVFGDDATGAPRAAPPPATLRLRDGRWIFQRRDR